MSTLASTGATIAAWAMTALVLLLVAAVFWSFLRRRGTVEGMTITSPADEVRRDRLAAAQRDPDAAPVGQQEAFVEPAGAPADVVGGTGTGGVPDAAPETGASEPDASADGSSGTGAGGS